MSSKYSVDHKEFGVEFSYGGMRLYLSVVINRPITTVELSRLNERDIKVLWDWGMSYCRPDDDWNPVRGLSKAASNLLEKINGAAAKEFHTAVWNVIEPALKDISAEKRRKDKLADQKMNDLLEEFLRGN
jgi:hypothetical protein